MLSIALSIALAAEPASPTPPADSRLDQAAELQRHELLPQAAELYIAALYAPKAADADRAECLYRLGEISFEEQERTGVALDDWTRLVTQFPDSPRSEEVKGRLEQMGQLLSKGVEKTSHQAIADVYLDNGDFWSPSDRIYHLDSSWLDSKGMASDWYDRVIKEFPGTKAAEIAYERKILMYVGGYTEGGKTIAGEPKRAAAIFAEMLKAVPNAGSIQRLRFVIGQDFWTRGDESSARAWFEQITQVGAKADDFYVRLARARLRALPHVDPNGQ